jgi:hypothetical protein
MFCPKCSQEQVSDEIRFCSRCGFQLGVVKALLASDDALLAGQIGKTPQPDRSLRKRDATIGAALMFLAALAVAVVTVDMPSAHSARIIFLVIAWFALSLLLNIKPIIGYFTHADASPDPAAAADDLSLSNNVFRRSSQLENKMQNSALPSAQVVPIADFVSPRGKTAEMVQPPPSPPSITEETTDLLRKN